MHPGITIEQKLFIVDSVKKYFAPCEILVFGSRITEKFRPSSDLDLCIRAKKALSLSDWSKLTADFVESDLPFKIDLLDWQRLSPDFQKNILKSCLIWVV